MSFQKNDQMVANNNPVDSDRGLFGSHYDKQIRTVASRINGQLATDSHWRDNPADLRAILGGPVVSALFAHVEQFRVITILNYTNYG
jgi:hypothetical protein